MTLPAGVTTCTVTLGKAVSYLGADASITATLSANKTVVHAATGWSIHSASDPVSANEGTELSFQVPHVNQTGFIDNAGNATTFWTYTLAGAIRFASGQSEPFSRTFQVLVGQSTLDLDLAPDGPTTPGVALPWAPLAMGTVTQGAPGSAPTATITGAVPNQVLNLVLPQGNTGPAGPQGTPGTGTVNLPTLVTNLVTNPSFEVDTAGWTTEANTTAVRSTADKYLGSASLLVTHATSGGAVSAAANLAGLTVGQTYTLTGYVKRQAGTQGVGLGIMSTPPTSPTSEAYAAAPTGWTRLRYTFVATSTTHTVQAYNASAYLTASTGTGSAFYLDAVMVTATPTPVDYFDGSTAGCWWTGTANASTSVRGLADNATLVKSYDHPELARNLAAYIESRWFGGGTGTNTVLTDPAVSGRVNRKTWTSVSTVPEDFGWHFAAAPAARVPVVAGAPYAMSAKVRTSRACVASFMVDWYDAAGAYTRTAYPTGAVLAGTTFQTVATMGTAPAGAVSATFIVYINESGARASLGNPAMLQMQVGDTLDLAEAILTVGPTQTRWFDGDQPGCRWTGTPYASESVKMLPARAETLIDAPELARNLVPYPAFRDGATTGWASDGTAGTITATSFSLVKTVTAAGDSGVVGTFRVPVVAGALVSARTAAKVSAARTVRFSILWFNAAGAYLSGSSRDLPIGAGATAEVAIIGATAPAGAASYTLQALALGAAVSDTLTVDNMLAVAGASLPTYFDGDTPGCRWVGTLGASESVKVLAQPADLSLLTWLDAGRAQGVGSPEGVVTAPVGARYVDTVATNGAIEWIKATGTGTTGWQVANGDTGARNVAASLVNATNVPTNGGGSYLRRVGRTVTLTMTDSTCAANLASASALLGPLPSGFRPGLDENGYLGIPAVSIAAPGTILVARLFPSYGSPASTLTNFGVWNAQRFSLRASWQTDDAWPTTLPGTAG